jgi:hypothetical protein
MAYIYFDWIVLVVGAKPFKAWASVFIQITWEHWKALHRGVMAHSSFWVEKDQKAASKDGGKPVMCHAIPARGLFRVQK